MHVPTGWRKLTLEECCDIVGEYGANSPSVEFSSNLPRYIRITDITLDGVLNKDGVVSVQLDGNEKYLLNEGDFLFARSGATVGKSLLYRESMGWAIYAGYLIRYRTNPKLLLPQYLQQFTLSDFYWAWVKTSLRAGAQPNINATEYSSLLIPLPPLPEQRKIAAILGTWDEAIDLTRRLIDALKQRKQALMQLLLTGEVRFPSFDEDWEEERIGQFLSESRVLGNDGRTARKLTVKLYGKGVFAKEEAREGSENTQYYIRKAGQFIYSKLDFLNGAFGIIPDELDGYETTLDLPTFDFSGEIYPSFLLAYVSREAFYKQFLGMAKGGRKARRIHPDEFLDIFIPTPSSPEQSQISDVITTLEHYENAMENYLEALQAQKRGLMQKLLTGQVRVQVEEDENGI